MKNKILVIEDDQDFREGLRLLLESKYEVQTTETGMAGIKSALRQRPDAILLDLKMPDMDGYQACKLLRDEPEFNNVPVIIVSGYNSAEDRTRAFELGADDFVAKPFKNAEMLARIQRKIDTFSLHKERAPEPGLPSVRVGNLEIFPHDQSVNVGGQPVNLSHLEFRLLLLLMSKSGSLVSRECIIEKVWDQQPVSSRIIDPHIVSLRNKMVGSDHAISSVYGKGYVLSKL